MKKLKLLLALLPVLSSNNKYGQDNSDYLLENALNGFEFRSIGPAFMSGRIADIAINPSNETTGMLLSGLEAHGKQKRRHYGYFNRRRVFLFN